MTDVKQREVLIQNACFCLQPERIEPPDPSKPAYDIRADVWALGISLVSRVLYTNRRLSLGISLISRRMTSKPMSDKSLVRLTLYPSQLAHSAVLDKSQAMSAHLPTLICFW